MQKMAAFSEMFDVEKVFSLLDRDESIDYDELEILNSIWEKVTELKFTLENEEKGDDEIHKRIKDIIILTDKYNKEHGGKLKW